MQNKTLAVMILLLSFVALPFVHAQYNTMALAPGVLLSLPAYSTVVGSSDYLYCSSWAWNTDDATATTLTYGNAYVGVGAAPVKSLLVSVQGGNLSFDALSLTGNSSFTLAGDGGDVAVQLQGFGASPQNVFVNDTQVTGWSYHGGNDTFSLALSDVDSDTVLFTLAASGVDMAVALAIVALIFAVTLPVTFWVMRRNNK